MRYMLWRFQIKKYRKQKKIFYGYLREVEFTCRPGRKQNRRDLHYELG
jgi:hypothetical protein